MKLYFLRHGETNWNVKRLAQGQVDIPLNDYGIYLAQETRKGFKNTHIDLCYSSPLSRALDTAKLILFNKDVPIIQDNRLIEFAFGDYEGICVSGPNKDKNADEFLKFFSDPTSFKPKGDGETIQDIITRTSDFIEDIKSQDNLQNKSILVSTHGCTLKFLLGYLENITDIKLLCNRMVSPNCGITTVEIDSEGLVHFIDRDVVYYQDEIRLWKVGE